MLEQGHRPQPPRGATRATRPPPASTASAAVNVPHSSVQPADPLAATLARAVPPVEDKANGATGFPVSAGATARGDALGATLARAVSQRARDIGAARHDVGATLQRTNATKASHLDRHISTFGEARESTRAFVAIRRALSVWHSMVHFGEAFETQAAQLERVADLCADFVTQHDADKRRQIVDELYQVLPLIAASRYDPVGDTARHWLDWAVENKWPELAYEALTTDWDDEPAYEALTTDLDD